VPHLVVIEAIKAGITLISPENTSYSCLPRKGKKIRN